MQKSDSYLIFGKGQVASFVPEYFENFRIADADITKPEEIAKEIEDFKPTVVINTAAMTSIDWCEQNKLQAFNVNTLGALNIWEACKKQGIFMVHFSSGCIYHSQTCDQLYKESDKPNPRCFYSWTKVWADTLLGRDQNLLIIRPRVVISSEVNVRNTLAKLMTYSHFIKDQNSITVVEDMLPVLLKMIGRRISGNFNFVNQGTISPFEIATSLRSVVNPDMEINETTLDEVNKNLVAKRVSTILDTTALKTVGYELPDAQVSVMKAIFRFADKLEKAGGKAALNMVREETRTKYSTQGKKITYIDKN